MSEFKTISNAMIQATNIVGKYIYRWTGLVRVWFKGTDYTVLNDCDGVKYIIHNHNGTVKVDRNKFVSEISKEYAECDLIFGDVLDGVA